MGECQSVFLLEEGVGDKFEKNIKKLLEGLEFCQKSSILTNVGAGMGLVATGKNGGKKMTKKEASALARKAIKLSGLKGITYRTEDGMSFDFIVWFSSDESSDEVKATLRKACEEVGLKDYSDPNNDPMTDYFGCHNSMILFNGGSL